MKKIHKITMLLGAMAFATTACTNSDNEPDYGEITLTTPVVTLDGVKATVSRADDAPNYSEMELHVDLLKQDGSSTNRSATYSYSSSSSSWTYDSPLVVTGGTGNYHARAWAKVDLNAVTDVNPLPAITGAIYATNNPAEMTVSDDGTFTFTSDNNALKPETAAIVLEVTNANGEKVTGYTVIYHLDRITTYNWNNTSSASEATSDENNGNFAPKTILSDTQIMTIKTSGGVTYTVSTSTNLTLVAGNLYTFNVKLGGNSQITIGSGSGEGSGEGSGGGSGITVNGFGESGSDDINIGRE